MDPAKPPTKSAVLIFIGAVIVSVMIVVGAVVGVVWQANDTAGSANHSWCQALELLTATPVTAPANPTANPSRVFAYDLYQDFRSIEIKFGC